MARRDWEEIDDECDEGDGDEEVPMDAVLFHHLLIAQDLDRDEPYTPE